ncbi:Uncharacterized conserved protein [Jatrophihabitans endophyticus]|uniref:Uncharacterized conserved protein n=1 Tax=Jatrophihabitans endophyticus TaxID=1206085 RepID=A0A1M5LI50_9ACTN|nr:hypothetical protein [Jatrophihabitans endophyticus]SHG64590.1 Uncharacterized conserved protein [Jatrophihabitans endophyticus]
MLPVGWFVAAVVLAVLVTMWFTFTLTRLDRLHARVDAAQAALDSQLVRRAAALQHVAESPHTRLPDDERTRFDDTARVALAAGAGGTELTARDGAENAVGRAVVDLVARPSDEPDAAHAAAVDELREAAARVLIARRFYNDAVRDTRALRDRRMPRMLRMAGRREMPPFFDIDDTLPAPTPTAARPARAEPTEED